MSQTHSELKYASSHEWARLEEDGTRHYRCFRSRPGGVG